MHLLSLFKLGSDPVVDTSCGWLEAGKLRLNAGKNGCNQFAGIIIMRLVTCRDHHASAEVIVIYTARCSITVFGDCIFEFAAHE